MKKLDAHRCSCAHNKVTSFCQSSIVPRSEPVTPPTLTNKESFYGLILEELAQYYRSLPTDFELDFGFLKSIKNLRPRGGEFDN